MELGMHNYGQGTYRVWLQVTSRQRKKVEVDDILPACMPAGVKWFVSRQNEKAEARASARRMTFGRRERKPYPCP
jgi:hypothetical protein